MLIRIRSLLDRLRGSLFWTPLGMIVVGGLLAPLVRWASHTYADATAHLPFLLTVSAQTGQQVLNATAVSTITVAGLVFSIMVVAVQLASSQFSPRVLRRFLADRYTQVSIGLLVGTFAYSLILLAMPPANEGSQRNLAVTVGLLLALASMVMLIAFIDHTARVMQVGRIVRQVTEETRSLIATVYPHRLDDHPVEPVDQGTPPHEPGYVIRSHRDGWIQQIDLDGLLAAVDADGALRVDLPVGKFAIEDMPLCTVWPEPEDPDTCRSEVLNAFAFGSQRAMRQDVAFGIRQLVDISLRALSPAINDPATAYEVISNLGAVLGDLLRRSLSPRVIVTDDGRRLYQPFERDHEQYVHLAFEQLRLAAAPHPAVVVAILNTLARLQELVRTQGLLAHVSMLRRQAALVLETMRLQSHTAEDLRRATAAASALGVAEASAGHEAEEQDDW